MWEEPIRLVAYSGTIAGFTLAEAAVAVTGAFVLWGLPTKDPTEQSMPPTVEPAT